MKDPRQGNAVEIVPVEDGWRIRKTHRSVPEARRWVGPTYSQPGRAVTEAKKRGLKVMRTQIDANTSATMTTATTIRGTTQMMTRTSSSS